MAYEAQQAAAGLQAVVTVLQEAPQGYAQEKEILQTELATVKHLLGRVAPDGTSELRLHLADQEVKNLRAAVAAAAQACDPTAITKKIEVEVINRLQKKIEEQNQKKLQ